MSKEIRVGLLAIVSLSLLIWGYKFLLGKNILSNDNVFYVEYQNVADLRVSDQISINGLQVGTVQAIYLKPEDLKTVVVELNIEKEIRLPKNTVAVLKSTSMMGGRFIDLKYQGVCKDDCLIKGDHIMGKSLGLLPSLLDPADIDQYLQTMRLGIGGVIDSVGAHLSDDANNELGTLLSDLRHTMGSVKNMTANIDHLFAASSSKMIGIFDHLESMTANIEANNAQISDLIKNANKISEQLANAGLDTTIRRANQALSSSGKTIESLEQTLVNANRSFAELTTMLKGINTGQGTLGSMAKDQALYDNLTATTRNLELLLQDFRLHPKRYINLSLFGKKEKKYAVPENDPGLDTIR